MWLVWNKTIRGGVAPSLETMAPHQSVDWKLRSQHVAQVMLVPKALQSASFSEIVAAMPCTEGMEP